MPVKKFGYLHRPAYRDRKTGKKKLSPYYYLRYKWKGQWHGIATRTSNLQDAEKVRWKVFGELFAGKLPWIEQPEPMLTEILDLTVRDYALNERRSADRLERSLKHLRADPAFRELRASLLTEERWEEYVASRRAAGAANATINRERAAVLRAFKLAMRRLDAEGRPLVSRMPFLPHLREAPPRRRFARPGEFEAIQAELLNTRQRQCEKYPQEASEMLADLAAFYFWTGWRKREALSLTWSHVNVFTRMIELTPEASKNAEGREIGFPEGHALDAILRRRRAHTDSVERRLRRAVPWVFHRNGRPVVDFRNAWNAACERAGITERLVPHDLRRTMARDLASAGVDPITIMRTVGWKSIGMLQRYRIVRGEDVSRGLDRLTHVRMQQAAARKGGRSADVVPFPGER